MLDALEKGGAEQSKREKEACLIQELKRRRNRRRNTN
jgi:hypothetical protein